MRASPDQLRRWMQGRRAAEQRELREQVDAVPAPGQALTSALRLIALARDRHGWPLPSDSHTADEDDRAWETWARLRLTARA